MLRVRQEQKISEMVSVGDISFPSTMQTPTYFLGWVPDVNTRSGESFYLTLRQFILGIT